MKFKFEQAKNKVEKILNPSKNHSGIEEAFPHQYDSKIIHISEIIEQAVDRHPERLSSFLNIKSNKKNIIMQEVNKRLDKMHHNTPELMAFIERFNKFIRTIELLPVRVY